jgi:hypothetical protein
VALDHNSGNNLCPEVLMTKMPEENSLRHQFELSLIPRRGTADSIDVSFLHRSFCVAGLPIKRPKAQHFSRNDSTFSLNINAPTLTLPGGQEVEVGVPFGPRARLEIVWMATEARNPRRDARNRWLEIGRIDEWLRSIGIRANHDAALSAKEQLVKLAFSSFTMILRDQGFDLFKSDKLIESAAFGDADLEHFAAGRLAKVRWPIALELSQKAYERFIGENAIAIPTQRLEAISHSAMAIDVFLYLCYRLPEIPKGDSDLVTWKRLIAQFGKPGEAPSKFRETFQSSIVAALGAYPEANLDLTEEGLVLRYSDPAELRRAFISTYQSNGDTKRRRKLRNRIENTSIPPRAVHARGEAADVA